MPWWAAVAVAAPYYADVPLATVSFDTVRTEHFAIHYASGDRRGRPVDAEPYALALAARADELLLDLCHVLQVDVPAQRIQVVVLDHEDEVNGFTLPHWSWIVLSAHPGSQLPRMRGRTDLAVDALAHELAHLVSHQAASALPEAMNYGLELGGTAEGAAGGVGVRIELDHDRPYGWSEGVAEFLSERVGVNRWNAEREARLRAAAREGRLLDWAELQRGEDKDPGDHERAYQQGYAFARWLEARHGEGTVARWVRARAGTGWPSWSRLLQRITGVPARQLHEAFLADVRADAAAHDARRLDEGIAEGEELLGWQPMWRRSESWAVDSWRARTPREREEGREATGSWRLCPAVAGGWLVDGRVGWVVATPRDEQELPGIASHWPQSAPPERPESLWVPARFGRSFAIDAQGQQLYGIGPTDDDRALPWLGGVELDSVWVVPLEEGGDARDRRRRVPGTDRAMALALSPDGSRLAWLGHEGGGQALWVGPVDGSAWERIDAWGMEAHAEGLSWSPEGDALVTSMRRGGMVDLWTLSIADRRWHALTRDRWHERDPHWTDDGLYFSADLDGVYDVFRLRDGEVLRLTRQRDGAICPSRTASGHLLYSAPTAHGVKAMGIRRSDLLGDDVSARFELQPDPARVAAALAHELPASAYQAQPYRRLRSLRPPAWGPFVRVDLTGDEVSPSVGAYGELADALERSELALFARVGDDHELELQLTEQAGWPELGVWGATRRERRRLPGGDTDLRGLDGAGVFVSRDWLPGWSGELEGHGLRVLRQGVEPGQGLLPAVEGLRGVARLRLDALDRRYDAQGADGVAELVVAHSHVPVTSPAGATGQGSWVRGRIGGRGQVAIAPRGSVSDGPHRLEVRLDAVVTSGDRAVDEEVPLGGDTPWARRPTAVEPLVPLPGYAPYRLTAEHAAAVGAAWAVPIAPRVRWMAGAWGLRRAELVAGGDVAAAWRMGEEGLGGPVPLGDAWAGLRLGALLRDVRFDSQVLLAVPIVGVPVGAPPLGVVPGASSWPDTPRIVVGIGTGW